MPRRIDIRQVFQRRLQEARLSSELSQRELGIKAGLDPSVASTRINRYELGVHEPDMATIQRLADTLSVPTAYLFADDDRLARMILAFDKLSVAEKDSLIKTAESE